MPRQELVRQAIIAHQARTHLDHQPTHAQWPIIVQSILQNLFHVLTEHT